MKKKAVEPTPFADLAAELRMCADKLEMHKEVEAVPVWLRAVVAKLEQDLKATANVVHIAERRL